MGLPSALTRLGLIGLAFASFGLAAPGAQALEFNVSTTADPADDALCLPGDCSLRQAINASNLLPFGDQINVPAGRYTLNAGFGPLWMLLGPATVTGQGPGQTVIDGAGGTGVLLVGGDSSPTISGVTITGGVDQFGAGIALDSSQPTQLTNVELSGNTAVADGPGSGLGGAIFLLGGKLGITDSTLTNNRAEGSATGTIGGSGGAIAAGGELTIANSTIANNTAGASGAGGGVGGGISGLLNLSVITNSTLSGNVAVGGPGGGGVGGGVSYTDSIASFVSSTMASNTATGGAGGNVSAGGGLMTYTNTIVSGGVDGNCAGNALVLTSGRSLDSTSQCGMGTYDMKGLDPQLGALGANGGPTQTMAPALTSPVIDAGVDCPPPATDQRGVARPQGAACDIGAVEQALPAPAAVTPAIRNLKLSATKFAASNSGTSMIAKKRRSIGTVVSYGLPSLASVRISVQRKTHGKYKTVKGSFTDDGNKGPNSFRFSGRMAGRKLKARKYRLVAVPTDTAGRVGAAARLGFRIVRR